MGRFKQHNQFDKLNSLNVNVQDGDLNTSFSNIINNPLSQVHDVTFGAGNIYNVINSMGSYLIINIGRFNMVNINGMTQLLKSFKRFTFPIGISNKLALIYLINILILFTLIFEPIFYSLTCIWNIINISIWTSYIFASLCMVNTLNIINKNMVIIL